MAIGRGMAQKIMVTDDFDGGHRMTRRCCDIETPPPITSTKPTSAWVFT